MNRAVDPLGTAVIGAFIMEGLRDLAECDGTSYNELLEAWGTGGLELVKECAVYALYIETKLQDYDGAEFPGVFDYEVSNPFGMWLGRRIMVNESEGFPTHDECIAEIDRLFEVFFSRGGES